MLTKKGKYGLKALVDLAGIEPGRARLLADIAAVNDIPKPFLEVILGELRQAGFVNSKKGRGGGYQLARPSTEIMIGHVIRVLDGPLAPLPCASRTSYRRCEDCHNETTCAVRLTMLDVRRAIADVLDHRSLAETAALTELDALSPMYHI